MARKPPVHTVPYGDGWANRREGATRVPKKFATKAEAQAAGRETARREKTEHLIHKRDGTVGARNSYGNDPRRSKG
jgi:predicted NUDIX family NTP pyrophosphohydrolase